MVSNYVHPLKLRFCFILSLFYNIVKKIIILYNKSQLRPSQSKSKMKSDWRYLSLKFLGQIFEKSEGV